MNMKFLSLFIISAFLLFSSVSSLLAMESGWDEKADEQKRSCSILEIINGPLNRKIKRIFDYWSLKEIKINLGEENFSEDTFHYIINTEFALHDLRLRNFPINKSGDDISAQNYLITGKDIKYLMNYRKPAPDLTFKSAADEIVYLGYGLYASNLRNEYYKNLLDDERYFVQCNRPNKAWKINGIIPKCYKIFSIEIDQDYEP